MDLPVLILIYILVMLPVLLVGLSILIIPLAVALRRSGGDWERIDRESRIWLFAEVLSVVVSVTLLSSLGMYSFELILKPYLAGSFGESAWVVGAALLATMFFSCHVPFLRSYNRFEKRTGQKHSDQLDTLKTP